jgi:uncharacterized membrane protein YsdA (DUF1294 family)
MPTTDIIEFIGLFAGLNVFVFSIYFADKQAARNGRRRVSERTLLMLAFFGGSIGAISAQRLLRHKTQKEPFRTVLQGIAVLHVLLVVMLVIGFGCVTLGFV